LRRFGENAKPKFNYTRRIGVYGLVHYRKKLLLTEQEILAQSLEISLPGGGVDKGEQYIHALHREVMEETGWHIQVLRKEGVFQRFTYMPEYKLWAHKICHIYSCKGVYEKTKILEKGHRYLIADYQKAFDMLIDPGFRYFVKNLKKSI